jgi:urea transport system permease protein
VRPHRLLLLALCAHAPAALALDADLLARLASEDGDEKIAAVRQLGASADPGALRVLRALGDGALATAGGRVVIEDGGRVLDAATGAELRPAPEDREPVMASNRIRREVGAAVAALRLFDPDRGVRLAAAQELVEHPQPEAAALLARALDGEPDGEIRSLLELARAEAALQDPDPAARLAATRALGEGATTARVRSILARRLDERVEPDADVRGAARRAIDAIDLRLAWREAAARVFSGLSLGSILLLAALGLAITYGVMGVINMAHGELLMIGAYATYAVQALFRRHLPQHVDAYVLAAIPVAFLAAAAVGVLLERTVIRVLYRRPLETLLATWGAGLILIQTVRTLFGAQNLEIANPSWMSGAVEPVAGLVLPWNRIAIIAFALAVLGAVALFLRQTRLGLFVRAVTQNRAMASCVGVSTGRVDSLAFGLGAGIAGLGGVALSQIANVGPDMGQAYIVDSFMVVVLGGVGQLAGAVGAALGLGVAAKFLEGWAGAVIAKIAVLVLVIVFIQKRPQGLFAPRGRTLEV